MFLWGLFVFQCDIGGESKAGSPRAKARERAESRRKVLSRIECDSTKIILSNWSSIPSTPLIHFGGLCVFIL